MPKFKDKFDREWEIKLDVGLIEDIQDQTGVNLDDVMNDKTEISKLIFTTPRKLVEILYVMCEKQIKQVPLTPREFASGFDRDSLDAASDAFLQSIILFYPRTSAGKVLAEEFPRMIAKMDAEIEKKTRESVSKVFSDTVTDLQG